MCPPSCFSAVKPFIYLAVRQLIALLAIISPALGIESESTPAQLDQIDVAQCEHAFSYSYRKPSTVDLPLVVYFGGGPSYPIVTTDSFPIPPEYGLLRFDYPGVASNKDVISCGRWSAKRISKVVIKILRQHRPNNYVLYGVSYGTTIATISTSLLEAETRITRPRVLLLEGVIGRAYIPGEVIRSYKDQWQEVLRKLPGDVRSSLSQIVGSQCTELGWGAWAEHALSIGAVAGQGHVAQEFLVRITKTQSKVGFCASPPALEIPASARLAYQELVCREINSTAPDHSHSFKLVDLALKPRAGNVCSGIALERPYDSAQWPIARTPIAYFVGVRDPATPLSHARYHISKQTRTSRIVLEVPEAGHNPLSVTLADCAQDLFRGYLESSNAVQKIRLEKCGHLTSFKVVRP